MSLYTPDGFSGDDYDDYDDGQDVAPALRIAERPSCIECYPAECMCGIAQMDLQAEPLTRAA